MSAAGGGMGGSKKEIPDEDGKKTEEGSSFNLNVQQGRGKKRKRSRKQNIPTRAPLSGHLDGILFPDAPQDAYDDDKNQAADKLVAQDEDDDDEDEDEDDDDDDKNDAKNQDVGDINADRDDDDDDKSTSGVAQNAVIDDKDDDDEDSVTQHKDP